MTERDPVPIARARRIRLWRSPCLSSRAVIEGQIDRYPACGFPRPRRVSVPAGGLPS